MKRPHPTILWAAAFAFAEGLLRFTVVGMHGELAPTYLLGLAMSSMALMPLALPLGVLVFSRSRLVSTCGWVLTLLVLLLNVVARHYEVVFGRLPGADLLFYYLGELRHLRSSTATNAPPAIVVAQIVAGLVPLIWIAIKGRSCAPPGLRASLALALTGVVFASPGMLGAGYLPDQVLWGTRTPVLWLAQSAALNHQFQSVEAQIDAADIYAFQHSLGHRVPFGAGNQHQPLCRIPRQRLAEPNRRSMILLIIEGLGDRELNWRVDDEPVMPNLQTFAEQNTHFRNLFASGSKSNQALPALLAGLPPQTYNNHLWSKPLLGFHSYVSSLRDAGYATAYFHGSDLSFEQQRTFLGRAGFETIFEPTLESDRPILGWGYDDGTMFEVLREWLETHEAEHSGQPFFSTLFTLGTHDPYVLPPNWPPHFSEGSSTLTNAADWWYLSRKENWRRRAADTYRYLDAQLGEFLDWLEHHDTLKDTLLLIVGDHNPPLNLVDEDAGQSAVYFRVPFIVSGTEMHGREPDEFRLAAQFDVAATASSLLGIPNQPCDNGLDLLAQQWPEQRIVYSVAGDQLEQIYLWTESNQFMLDRQTGKVTFEHFEPPIGIRRPVTREEATRAADMVLSFVDVLFPVNAFLYQNDAYFVEAPVDLPDPLRTTTARRAPIFVSHRGNTEGPAGPAVENTPHALANAVRSGFRWAEVDTQVTRDGILILHHDPHFNTPRGNVEIGRLTLAELRETLEPESVWTLESVLEEYSPHLNFLIEAKPQKNIALSQIMARGVADLVRRFGDTTELIVDSFDWDMAASIRNLCGECEVGVDAPFREKIGAEIVSAAVERGFSWIYVHWDVVTPELLKEAHRQGLKIMAYTVNDVEQLFSWKGYLPDGVITDHYSVVREWNLAHAATFAKATGHEPRTGTVAETGVQTFHGG